MRITNMFIPLLLCSQKLQPLDLYVADLISKHIVGMSTTPGLPNAQILTMFTQVYLHTLIHASENE